MRSQIQIEKQRNPIRYLYEILTLNIYIIEKFSLTLLMLSTLIVNDRRDYRLIKMRREHDVKKKSKFSIAPTDSTILVEFWIVDNISTVHGV